MEHGGTETEEDAVRRADMRRHGVICRCGKAMPGAVLAGLVLADVEGSVCLDHPLQSVFSGCFGSPG
eukprot:223414-Pelagomonas_calceolata.AAC.3